MSITQRIPDEERAVPGGERQAVERVRLELNGIPRYNLAATVAPDADNDETEGYAVGSQWVDVSAGAAYVCADATEGAAVWLPVGGGSGSGDMLKSVYDVDDSGRVDAAETLDDGTYSATAQDVAEHLANESNPHAVAGSQLSDLPADGDVYLDGEGNWTTPPGGSNYDGDITVLNIDGGTDIGAALADADLIIVDDGASGTNRKCAMSRVKTYAQGIKLDDLSTPDDNTDLNASTSVHGLLPKGSNSQYDVLLGTVAWGAADAAIKRIVTVQVIADATTLTTGDGKAFLFIPADLNGFNLVDADACVSTVSSSGLPTVQIRNVTDSVDMLSTRITIDANEKTSWTAATAPVIDTTKDDVATGDQIAIDVDGAGTGAKGLQVVLVFQKP